jgi:eukaryotic-like serine/threonine-protein kinase
VFMCTVLQDRGSQCCKSVNSAESAAITKLFCHIDIAPCLDETHVRVAEAHKSLIAHKLCISTIKGFLRPRLCTSSTHDRDVATRPMLYRAERLAFSSKTVRKRMTPAEQLGGETLAGGWIVGQRVSPKPTGTGGHFSIGYLVSHSDGRKGFLKAMDYTAAFASANTADELKRLTEAYTFEREIHLKCNDHRITRVVHALHYGSHVATTSPLGLFAKVEYLIFERADGDVRAMLDRLPAFDLVFALRTLHSAAAALMQMHSVGIAHQDLKPSNVLIFEAERQAKLGDLGRAWDKNIPAPHHVFAIAGDLGYAPPELLYGQPLAEDDRRFGCDIYLLGSLAVFLFTRVHINALLTKHLDPSFRVRHANLTYDGVVTYLKSAFADALDEFSMHVPEVVRDTLTLIVAELCEPDYRRRGNPIKTSIKRTKLVRYISLLDALVRKAEADL